MGWWFPEIRRGCWRGLIACAGWGAVVAGAYGILHDQLTYTICPEYFTKFKFEQFGYADFALAGGDRGFVCAIGFLATWWVGCIAGWFLRRLAIRPDGSAPPVGETLKLFWVVVATGFALGLAGFCYGRLSRPASARWISWMESMGIGDHGAFYTVGQIHNFSYLGAFIGLIIAGTLARRRRGGADLR